jgi:hypothetical protein
MVLEPSALEKPHYAETAAVNAIASGSQHRNMNAISNRIARFESASAPEWGLGASVAI